jgi:hypothetical protein
VFGLFFVFSLMDKIVHVLPVCILTVTEVRGFNVNLILVSNMKTEC